MSEEKTLDLILDALECIAEDSVKQTRLLERMAAAHENLLHTVTQLLSASMEAAPALLAAAARGEVDTPGEAPTPFAGLPFCKKCGAKAKASEVGKVCDVCCAGVVSAEGLGAPPSA